MSRAECCQEAGKEGTDSYSTRAQHSVLWNRLISILLVCVPDH